MQFGINKHVIYRHPVIAATRAPRLPDHVTKRNGGSGDENVEKHAPWSREWEHSIQQKDYNTEEKENQVKLKIVDKAIFHEEMTENNKIYGLLQNH